MSKDSFVKFYEEYVPKHAALQKQLDGIHNEQEFTKIALVEGPKGGFTFTAEEVAAVMETQKEARKQKRLSDKQLDAVVGGAGLPGGGNINIGNISANKAIAGPGALNLPNIAEEGTIMCCW